VFPIVHCCGRQKKPGNKAGLSTFTVPTQGGKPGARMRVISLVEVKKAFTEAWAASVRGAAVSMERTVPVGAQKTKADMGRP
jgi:hypothetical protein